MSPKAAGLAVQSGHGNTRVFLAGEPAWAKAGLATYAAKEFIEHGNIVLIDLRPGADDKAARIPRSVSIPSAILADRMDDIPRKAPVVLYSDNEKEMTEALTILRAAGFSKASLVPGGFDAWLAGKGKTESGPPVTTITWQRKIGKGEVNPADFRQAVAGKADDVVILDVRTKDETKDGTFTSALIIPLDELAQRADELPRDKTIYIHCSTGARAELAQKELQQHGLKALFLVADIMCEQGKCEIEE